MSPSYQLLRVQDPADLARRASELMAASIDIALDQRDRAQIALSGGSTPAESYSRLALQHLPWDRVDVLLGDERWVAADDASSNARMLRQTLLARGTPGAAARFHAVPTVETASPEDSAVAFADLVQSLCPGSPPIFDLMVLGLGDDGHTASLFPGTEAVDEQARWTTIGRGKGLDRITLTAPVLSAARQVVFLVSGAGKQQALAHLLDASESPARTPAKLVRPAKPITVLADAQACAGL